ncbi:MAG: hypothetical protein IPM68_14285 [Flavobacteriales bacterium]|nr:hypothetical protein [Flavobacteriales bacterium]
MEHLVRDHDVEVHIVRWPVNREAPFDLRFGDRVKVHERDALDDQALMRLTHGVGPDIAFASGWVDKGYLRGAMSHAAQAGPAHGDVQRHGLAW